MSNASNPGVRPGETPTLDGRTVIGVDLGVKRLLVAAPASASPDVTDAVAVGGGVAKDLFDGLGDTLGQLEELPADTTEAETQVVADYRRLIYQRIGVATTELIAYLERVGADVVAFEDVKHGDLDLADAARGSTKAGSWILPTARSRLETVLVKAGYRVGRVPTEHTTQRCHVCGELSQVSDATIRCDVNACPVDRVCRDRSAAVTIAKRYDNRVHTLHSTHE